MQMVLILFWLHVTSVSSEINGNRWAYMLIHATIQYVAVVVYRGIVVVSYCSNLLLLRNQLHLLHASLI